MLSGWCAASGTLLTDNKNIFFYLLRLVVSVEGVFLTPKDIVLSATHYMNIATNQVRMHKFARQIALIQHISFVCRYSSAVPIRLGLTFFLLAGLISCSSLSPYGMSTIGANVTPIGDLKTQQKRDHQTTVYIRGKVERQVPLLQRWAYQINDSTGEIWVITRQMGLKKGDNVVFKGQIRYQSIPLAGKEYGEVYLEEFRSQESGVRS